MQINLIHKKDVLLLQIGILKGVKAEEAELI
jgi:hypothetical protein